MKRTMKKIVFYICVCILFSIKIVPTWAGLYSMNEDNNNDTIIVEKGNQAIIATNMTNGMKPILNRKSIRFQKQYKNLKVKTNNKKVAMINKYGLVNAKKVGSTIVTISIGKKKSQKKSWKVIVKKKLTPDEMFHYTMKKDDEGKDYITITGYKAFNTKVYVPSQINGIPVKKVEMKTWYSIYKRAIKEIYFEDGITEIGDYAFAYNPTLQKIRLPGTLEKLGIGVFRNLTQLEELNIEEIYDIGYIPDYTFFESGLGWKCSNEIVIPGRVITIGEDAFATCGIQKLTISEGVQEIGIEAFGNNRFQELTIPSTVKKIEVGAFSHLYLTKLINLSPNVQIESAAFWETSICVGNVVNERGRLKFDSYQNDTDN